MEMNWTFCIQLSINFSLVDADDVRIMLVNESVQEVAIYYAADAVDIPRSDSYLRTCFSVSCDCFHGCVFFQGQQVNILIEHLRFCFWKLDHEWIDRHIHWLTIINGQLVSIFELTCIFLSSWAAPQYKMDSNYGIKWWNWVNHTFL